MSQKTAGEMTRRILEETTGKISARIPVFPDGNHTKIGKIGIGKQYLKELRKKY